MGNNASSLPEAIVSLSTSELKKTRSADKSWLSLPPSVSDFASTDSPSVADLPEARELDSNCSSHADTMHSDEMHGELAFVVPLPHSDAEKQLEEVLAKLTGTVHAKVGVANYQNNEIAKALNALLKGHSALQRVRRLEAKSAEEAQAPASVSATLTLSAIPLLWILSTPSLLEGSAGQSFFQMVNSVTAGSAVCGLMKTEFAEAKTALLAAANALVEKTPGAVSIALGLALGFGDLPGVLSVVEKLLKGGVRDEDVLSLKPQLQTLLSYQANPNPDCYTARFTRGNSIVSLSPSSKTATYDGSQGNTACYLQDSFSRGSVYVEFAMEQSVVIVEVSDAAYMMKTGNDLSRSRIRLHETGYLEYPGNNENLGSYETKDRIGVHLNFLEKTITFYKNATKMFEKPLPFSQVHVGVQFEHSAQVAVSEVSDNWPSLTAACLRPVPAATCAVNLNSDQTHLSLRTALAVSRALGDIANHFNAMVKSVVDLPNYMSCYGLGIDTRKEVFAGIYAVLKALQEAHGTAHEELRPLISDSLHSVLALLDLQLNIAGKMHQTESFAADKQLVDQCYKLMTGELLPISAEISTAVEKTVGSALDVFLSNEENRLAYILEQLTRAEAKEVFQHLAKATLIDPMLQHLPVDELKRLQKELVKKTLHSNNPHLLKFFWAYATLLFSDYSFTDQERMLPLCLDFLSELTNAVRSCVAEGRVDALLWNAEALHLLLLAVALCKFPVESLMRVFQPLLDMLDIVCEIKKPQDDEVVTTKQTALTVSGTNEYSFQRASFVLSTTKPELLGPDTKVSIVASGKTQNYSAEEITAGVWTKMLSSVTAQVSVSGQPGASVELAVTEETVHKDFYRTNIKLLRESLTYSILKLSTALVAGSFKASENQSEEVKKALSNPIVSAGIRDNAWIFLKETVGIPTFLEELSGPLLIEEESEAEPEMPGFGRSFSMMTEKESSSSVAQDSSAPKGDLSSYFNFLRKATQLPFLMEQSVFLESLIEGKGSPGQLWTHVHKLLGLDRKPYSRMGGSICDKAERMVLAVLIKFSDLKKDVERLTLETTEVPQHVADLWRKANLIRGHLVQKQQTENIEDAAQRTIQLGILLLNSDFKASLTALGFNAKQAQSRVRRKSEDRPTFTKALSLNPEVNKETTQALEMLKRLKKGYHHDPTQSEPGSLPELIITFLKSSVNVAALGQEIKSRREHAISRVIGLGMLHLLQKKAKVGGLVAKCFAEVVQKRHYLEGLGGIDPGLQECLRNYFFKIYNTCCESFLTVASKTPIVAKTDTLLTLNRLLGAIAYAFKPADFANLTNLRLQQTLTQLLRCAKSSVKTVKRTFNRGEVVTSITKGEGENLVTLVKKESSRKWIVDCCLAAEKPGWKKFDHNFGTEEAPKFLHYQRGRAPRYLTALSVSATGELTTTFKSHKELKQCGDSEQLPTSLRQICWTIIKLFIYTFVQAKGTEASSAAAVKFTEVFLHSIYEELNVSYGNPKESLNVMSVIKGEEWEDTKQNPSPAQQTFNELKDLTKTNVPEVFAMLSRYEQWDTKKTLAAIPVAAIKAADPEAPELNPQWLNAEGSFDVLVYLRAIRAGHGADALKEESRKFLADYKQLDTLKSAMSELDTKPAKPTESEAYVHSLLWLLLVSSHSETAVKILRSPDYLKLLLDLGFSKEHVSFNTFAFRVLEFVMPTIDRIETLDAALSPKVKESMGHWLESEFAASSFLRLITALSSILVTRKLNWSAKPKSDVASMLPVADCCRGLLVNALNSNSWKSAFLSMVEECTDRLRRASEDSTNAALVEDYPNLLGAYHILTGALAISEAPETETFTLLKQVRQPFIALVAITSVGSARLYNYESKDVSDPQPTGGSSDVIDPSTWDEASYTQFLAQLLTLVTVRKNLGKRILENTRIVNVHRAFLGFLRNSICFYLRDPRYVSLEAAQTAITLLLTDFKRSTQTEPSLRKMREVLVKALDSKKESEAKPERASSRQRSRSSSIDIGGFFGSEEENAAAKPAEEVKEEEQKEEPKVEEEKAEQLNCLHRITKQQMSPFAQVSCHRESSFYENEFGNPTILSKKPARMDLTFTHELFRNVTNTATFNGVTAQVALGPADGVFTGAFGFRFGSLAVEISTKSAETLTMTVVTATERYALGEVPNANTVCVSVQLQLNGLVRAKVFGAEAKVEFGPMENSPFTGYSLADFSFFTTSQETLTLRGLQVFEGLIQAEQKFWSEAALDTSSKPLSSRIASVNIKTETTDLSEVLNISGAGAALETAANTDSDGLHSSLDRLLYGSDLAAWTHEQKVECLDYPIVDIRLFYKRADVPKTYEVAKYWLDGKLVGECNEENCPGRKIIAYLKRPMASSETIIEGITMIPKTQEMNNYSYIGNLAIGENETHEPELSSLPQNGLQSLIYITRKSVQKLPSNFLTSIAILETSSTAFVNTPRGYMPVPYFTKDSDSAKANVSVLNLDVSPTANRLVTLAVSTSTNVLGFPIRSLATKTTGTDTKFTGGMVDSYDNAPVEEVEVDIKDFENGLKEWTQFEMECSLRGIEEQLSVYKSAAAIEQLAVKHPAALCAALSSREVLSTFLSVAILKAKDLSSVFAALLQGEDEDVERLRKNIVLEAALQLYLQATQEKVINLMPTRLIESIHPYDNNMNVQDVISIPGATSLLLEFDPQTKTESGCDPLRFYRRAGNVEEICVYSGDFSNFKPLEIEGDTVYMKFTSDGSVVYWGYKFTVTPKSKSRPKAAVRAPEYQTMNVAVALWLLDNYKAWNLDSHLEKLTSSAVINAAGIAMHNITGPLQTKMIAAFQSLLQSGTVQDLQPIKGKTAEENLDWFVAELERHITNSPLCQWREALEREAKELYGAEIGEPDVSPKTKALAGLLANISKDQTWLNYCKTVFGLEGISSNGARYYALLLNFAQETGLISLNRVEEIEAHYSRAETVKKISIPGAGVVSVQIEEKPSSEPHHSVVFSLHEDMSEIVTSSNEKMVESTASFSTTQKGGSFTVLPDGRTVQYQNSTWQTIIVDKEFKHDQRFVVEYLLEECSDTDNLGFGLHEIAQSYNCNNCGLPGNGFAPRSWCLRGNGEFYSPGSTNINERMSVGCRVSIEGDLRTKSFAWFLNGKRVGQLVLDTNRIMLNFTTYNNCKVVITKFMESVTLGTELPGREYLVPSGTFYYAFPVNRAYEDWMALAYMAPYDKMNVNMQFTCPDFSNAFQRVLVNPRFGHGKSYREVQIIDTLGALLEVGIADHSESLDATLMAGGSYALASSGDVNFAGSKSTAAKGFKNGDLVSFLADAEARKVTFWVNGEEVATGDFNLGVKHYAAACCHSAGQKFLFVKDTPPKSILHLEESGKSKKTGFKMTMKPVITGVEGLMLVKNLSAADRAAFIPFLNLHTRFTRFADSDLCAYVDSIAKKQSLKCSEMKPAVLTCEKDDMVLYPMLEPFSAEDLHSRFALILHINSLFSTSFKLVDLSLPGDLSKASRMQKVIVHCREYLFYDLKHEMLQSIMRSTNCDSRTDISINRMRANTLMLRGVKDTQNTVSVFAQAMKIINPWQHRNLRNSERIFTVNLMNESAGDAGGPYNEVITTMSEELMSDFLPLFVKTPNNVQNIGTNRDTYTISPDATSQMNMEMYLFLGKLFGVAIRTQNNLHLFLPPLFWKKLMLAPVTLTDLKGIDESVYQAIELLRNPASKNVDAEQFKELLNDFTFTIKNSAGTSIDLKPGGSTIPVTQENVAEYCDLIEKYRLTENDRAYLEIRKGMSAVIPLDILNLLSWSQVESLVGGAPTWDVERVKNNTHYEGYSASDRVVQDFWGVVSELTIEQKVLFLRFSWGRSRLPASGTFKNFQLTRMSKSDPDHALPAAHTCFFTIDLPEYTTRDVLRERLVFAITHCQAYDMDHLPDEIDQPQDQEEEE